MIGAMAKAQQASTCPQGKLRRACEHLKARDGQALVEFALVLPIILLLILGIIDFGRAFNYQNDMTSLANQAVRFAEVNSCTPCGTSSIQDYVRGTADSGELKNGTSGTIGIAQPGVCVSISTPDGAALGKKIVAKVSATYRWLPFFHFLNVTISGTVTGRQEAAFGLGTSFTPGTSSNYSGSCP